MTTIAIVFEMTLNLFVIGTAATAVYLFATILLGAN